MPARGGIEVLFYTQGHYDPSLTLAAQAWFTTRERLDRLEEPLGEAVQVVISEVYTNFMVQGRPPWQPLTKETIAEKTRKGSVSKGILQDTGIMLEEATNPDNWAFIREAANTVTASMGEPTEYTHFHTEGAPGAGVPQRDFLFLPEEAEVKIDDIFQEWIRGVALASFS